MTTFEITRSRRIPAPAAQLYRLIADFNQGHPRIVPTKYFSDLAVEAGGVGAGTTIRYATHVLGTTQQARAHVTEPEPGRVLVEREERSGAVTTFIVDALDGGRQADVSISTAFPARAGLRGAIERLISRAVVRRIYAAELAQLERVALADAAAARGATKAA